MKKTQLNIELNKFLQLKNGRELAEFLGINYSKMMYLLNLTKKKCVKPRYVEITIPKKSGGVRLISIPNRSVLHLQRQICSYLNFIYIPTLASHGYIKSKTNSEKKRSRSIVTNALVHKKSFEVLNLDLKDFFPSINGKRIFRLFKSTPFNFPNSVAAILTEICVHDQKKSLPQGAATSPILSNMIAVRLDNKLLKYARQNDLKYTRYVDDLTFSSNYANAFKNDQLTAIRKIISDEGFIVNESKVRMQKWSVRQEVTGLVVNSKVNVKRDYIRNIRAMLKKLEVKGLKYCQDEFKGKYSSQSQVKWIFTSNSESQKKYADSRTHKNVNFLEMLKGRIEFVGNVRGKTKSEDEFEIYKKLKTKFDTLTIQKSTPETSISRTSQETDNPKNDLKTIEDSFD